VVIAIVRPRVGWVPTASESLGADAVEFARRVGMTLDPEQELVLDGSLGLREDGRWQTREVGVNMPRQNGKGEILLARELFGLFELGERLLIHTAHEFKTSAEHFQRLEAVIRACPELHARVHRRPSGQIDGYRYSHGEESITLQDGARIEFKTRTKSGMRGFAGVDFLALDEAMIISEAAHSSGMPIIRASKARRGPQLWYAGSAVDQETHEQGVVWARVRERGLTADDPSLAYFEWSLDVGHPDDVTEEMALDVALWRQVNFAVARGRVPEEHMEWERRAMSLRGFIVELLGVGDWPRTDGTSGFALSLEQWVELADAGSSIVGPVWFAFDVSPDRAWASIAASGRRADGLAHVEIVERRRGTSWLPDRLAGLVEKHDTAGVICDAVGPAASVLHLLSELEVEVETTSAREHANACGLLFDLVEEKGLRHLGTAELSSAVKGATKRPLGDAWAWSRKDSHVDISPLVAATLALFAASSQADTGDEYVFDSRKVAA
jgi:hypothetical protein